MRKIVDIDLTPAEYCTHDLLCRAVAHKAHLHVDDIAHVEVLRRSLDSRRGIRYHATVEVYCGEDYVAPDSRPRVGAETHCHRAWTTGGAATS